MSVLALLALGLTLAGEAKAESSKPYTIDTRGTSTQVVRGKSGVLKLQIVPAKGYKVSAEAPLKISLSADGLSLTKAQLGHADQEDPKSTAPRFEVGFGANESGKRKIEAEAMFFVCSEELCEKRTEKLSVAVDVDG